jgi:hypothetical protein
MRKTKEVLRLRFELGLGRARLRAVAPWAWEPYMNTCSEPRPWESVGRCRKDGTKRKLESVVFGGAPSRTVDPNKAAPDFAADPS